MRALAALAEELESRPADADRVDALARHLRAVGRDAGALAGAWLVEGARTPRPTRLTQAALADAARELAARHGTAPWLFDAGRASADEAAEAVALLLPWPDGPTSTTSHPPLADWLADWAEAAVQPPDTRAIAIAATIACLDDAMSRRWAVRAVCGLAKPVVDEWQWQRAWARAFDADPLDVAWWWRHRRDALLHDLAAPSMPRPRAFASLDEPDASAHPALLAAWRAGEWRAEPRWSGVRVHVARRGDDVGVWQRGGRLLNAHVPADWLEAAQWPDGAVIEAVLLAWLAGVVVPLAQATARRGATVATLHLALTDWHRDDDAPAARRTRLLARWPAPDDDLAALPPIFTTPSLHLPEAESMADAARAARAAGWSGLVLRHATTLAAWAVRAPAHRIRAVLQYVPGDALAAGSAAAMALAFVDCGFALWNRAPRSQAELHAAMTAAMSGEFMPPPDDAPGEDGLRLLPLARLPIALPDDELRRLHDWLRANAGQRFGGVHAVAPVQVFEIAYAEARPSRRHRLGATLAGARVVRWVLDAPPGAAQLAADLVLP